MHPQNEENISDFYERLARFEGLSQSDQILRAAWFVQTSQKSHRFQPKDITGFFSQLSLSPPNVHTNLARHCERKPATILWDRGGYYLEGKCFRALSDTLSIKLGVVQHITSQSLHGLADKLGQVAQRSYLAETMNCYRAGAFRASVVMAWNLAYDHLTRWLITEPARLSAFNASLSVKYPKTSSLISSLDNMSGVKEFAVVETAHHANLINKHMNDLLKEKLKRRNAAAHPSDLIITQAQADDMITDLINNVIAKLSIVESLSSIAITPPSPHSPQTPAA